MPVDSANTLEHWFKIAGVLLTLSGLLAGGYQFTRSQAVEASRPFLEKKLKWCEEAVETAAGIAVHGRDSTVPSAAGSHSILREERFWALYWGLMGMVENQDVTDAMVAFGNNLKSGEASADNANALNIAHACRSEMARSWSSVWSR